MTLFALGVWHVTISSVVFVSGGLGHAALSSSIAATFGACTGRLAVGEQGKA